MRKHWGFFIPLRLTKPEDYRQINIFACSEHAMQSHDSWTDINPAIKQKYLTAIWMVISAGIALRLFHFFDNRSLWEDEVYLSAGIVKMTFYDLLHQQLPYLQKAPLGYLLVARLMVDLFGNHEMALRLYPLLAGVAAQFLFVPVVRHFLKPLGALVAVALLALSPPLVYHSVEAKPYGTELCGTILVIWWYIRYRYETDIKQLLLLGLYGAILVWFAYTAIFLLAAMALAISLPYLRHRKWKIVVRLVLPSALWLISFGITYLLFAKAGSHSGWLIDFWKHHDGYIPVSPVSGVIWMVHRLFSFFHYPLGLSWQNDWMVHGAVRQIIQRAAWLPLLLMPAGIIYFYGKRNYSFLPMAFTTLFVALMGSALRLYPFHERLTVYLAPVVIVLLAGGCEWFSAKGKAVKWIGFGLAAMLLVGPAKNSISQVAHTNLFGDYKKSYQREAMQYVNSRYQPGDAVYVYRTDIPAYWFYKDLLPLKFAGTLGKDYRVNSYNFEEYFVKVDADIASVGSKRVWIMYNTMDAKVGEYVDVPAWYYKNHDGIERFREHLLKTGIKLDEFYPADGGTTSNVHAVLIERKE
jgi:4-amino-4-deoxy-L-arabinose transferase-like glycosyltransferase